MNNQSFTNNILSPIKTIKKPLSKINIKNFASFFDSTTETTTKIKREKSSFSFQTNINNIKNKKNFSYIYSSQNKIEDLYQVLIKLVSKKIDGDSLMNLFGKNFSEGNCFFY